MSATALIASLLLRAALDGGALVPPPEQFQQQLDDPLLAPAPRAERELASWEEALAQVRAASTDERSAAAAVERAEGRWRQSLGVLLPNARLSLSVGVDALNAASTPSVSAPAAVTGANVPTTPLGTATVGLTQSLVDVGAWKALASARAAQRGATETLTDVRRRLTRALARTLVAVVAAERVAELNRVGLRQALERAALIGRTQQLGAATQVDVVRVRQDVEVARGALIAGDEQLRQVREALGLAVGAAGEVGVPAGFALSGLGAEVAQRCKAVGWEQRPDLEAARRAVDVAAESTAQAQLGYLPSLGLTSNFFSYTSNPGPFRLATWNLAAVLTVPLWEGGTREGLVRERKGLEVQASQALEASRRAVRLEAAQARRAVGVAEALTKTAGDARAMAAQLDALTRRSFEVGRGSSLELVQSAGALRQADVTLLTREFERVQARLEVLLVEARCEW